MNILILGTTILAINVTEDTDNIVSDDAIYPKHVIPGWQIVAAELPVDYGPGRYKWDGGFVLIPVATPPIPIPTSVTMRQARLALLGAGLLASIDTAIASLPSPQKEAAQIEWDYAQEIKRDWPTLLALASLLGLSSEQLDELFITAAGL